jgi:hypothetical protein
MFPTLPLKTLAQVPKERNLGGNEYLSAVCASKAPAYLQSCSLEGHAGWEHMVFPQLGKRTHATWWTCCKGRSSKQILHSWADCLGTQQGQGGPRVSCTLFCTFIHGTSWMGATHLNCNPHWLSLSLLFCRENYATSRSTVYSGRMKSLRKITAVTVPESLSQAGPQWPPLISMPADLVVPQHSDECPGFAAPKGH